MPQPASHHPFHPSAMDWCTEWVHEEEWLEPQAPVSHCANHLITKKTASCDTSDYQRQKPTLHHLGTASVVTADTLTPVKCGDDTWTLWYLRVGWNLPSSAFCKPGFVD
ncbi:hypothetical protein STEG23_025845, partial [Scotinomys teguina]